MNVKARVGQCVADQHLQFFGVYRLAPAALHGNADPPPAQWANAQAGHGVGQIAYPAFTVQHRQISEVAVFKHVADRQRGVQVKTIATPDNDLRTCAQVKQVCKQSNQATRQIEASRHHL